MTDVSLLEIQPKEGHCHFYVTRKKRFCRMTIKPGATYCGEHQLKIDPNYETVNESDALKRMACPLDPKQAIFCIFGFSTCFVSKLKKHLKVCNARQMNLPSYIVKNCNIPTEDNILSDTEKTPLCNIPTTKVIEIIAIIEKIYQDNVQNNISNMLNVQPHPSVSAELLNEKRGNNTKRHLEQTSSLLNIIEANNLLNDNTCFAELGAGKGHVSYYLASAVKNKNSSSVLLIDKASHRHKQDNKLDKQNFAVTRIRADISDLMVAEIPLIKISEKIVGVSKHLCGGATDLALRCLTNSSVVDKTFGIVMALCCHHRCQWLSYTGKKFLKDNDIDQQKFDIICGLVSWATCGSGLSRSRQLENDSLNPAKKMKLNLPPSEKNFENEILSNSYNNNQQETDCFHDDNSDFSVPQNSMNINDVKSVECKKNIKKDLGLSQSQKEEIGFKAKAVLDWGRVLFLKENGFNVNLCFYVDKSISLENVCLIATKLN